MPNLNEHDLILFNESEFRGFENFLEVKYKFKILSTEYPDYISFTSRKAILNTDSGSFFLKEKPKYSSDEISLNRSFLFQEYSSLKLLKVPKIKLTEDGEYYIRWKEKFYFLTEYKRGRVFNGSLGDIASMLKALKDLQVVGDEFKNKNNIPSGVLDIVESYEVAKYTTLVEKFIQSKKDRIIYKRIIKCQNNLKKEYLKHKKINYLMAHSDYIVFNLVFDDKGVIAINDYDNAKVLPRIHDLAEFLVSSTLLNYVGSTTNLKLPVLLTPQSEKLKIILKEYKDLFSLSDDELKLLSTIAEIVWLWTLSLSILKGDYALSDLENALDLIEKHELSKTILKFADL